MPLYRWTLAATRRARLVVTERGEALHPFFEETVGARMVPTMSSTVTVSVWDEDTVSDDLIGYVTGLSFKQARAEPVARAGSAYPHRGG